MIVPKLLLCATGIVRDTQTNNISVFNILEQINFASFPGAIADFFILSVIERESGDPEVLTGKLCIKIGEISILEQDVEYNFQNKNRTRLIVGLGGLPIPQPGILSISMSYNGNELHKYNIQIEGKDIATIKKIDQG